MLTIIIPVYNEINTIEKILDKIDQINFISKEIILVDDCSSDGTKTLIERKLFKRVSKVIYHNTNNGKGSAIKSAQNFINGKYVIIQDADLEYDPWDYQYLLKPLIDEKFDVVYGSRVLGKSRYKLKNFTSISRIFGNHILTIISNLINKQNLTDAHTCYKAFTAKVF
jgi:Glycosyltransferases, probably involved in cell wall biogenesis